MEYFVLIALLVSPTGEARAFESETTFGSEAACERVVRDLVPRLEQTEAVEHAKAACVKRTDV